MHRRSVRRTKKFIWLVAFGVGLLVASFCPPKLLIGILALAVIVLGISGSKC